MGLSPPLTSLILSGSACVRMCCGRGSFVLNSLTESSVSLYLCVFRLRGTHLIGFLPRKQQEFYNLSCSSGDARLQQPLNAASNTRLAECFPPYVLLRFTEPPPPRCPSPPVLQFSVVFLSLTFAPASFTIHYVLHSAVQPVPTRCLLAGLR